MSEMQSTLDGNSNIKYCREKKVNKIQNIAIGNIQKSNREK